MNSIQPNNVQQPINNINMTSNKIGGKPTIFTPLINTVSQVFHYLHSHILYLDNSKFLVGIVMILLNIGSKFIVIQFSKSTEEYLRNTVTKQLLIFCMSFMGTRSILISLTLTAIFTILSDHLFNEESPYCIVPHEHRVLHKLIDTNGDGSISETEIAAANALLEKARREKELKAQKEAFRKFDFEKSTLV